MQPMSFAARLHHENISPTRFGLGTVQINVDKLCNQICLHYWRGAPDPNPSFYFLVEQDRLDSRHMLDRCNFAVLLESGQEGLPTFLAMMDAEGMASLLLCLLKRR